jgi:hypothetical protein
LSRDLVAGIVVHRRRGKEPHRHDDDRDNARTDGSMPAEATGPPLSRPEQRNLDVDAP